MNGSNLSQRAFKVLMNVLELPDKQVKEIITIATSELKHRKEHRFDDLMAKRKSPDLQSLIDSIPDGSILILKKNSDAFKYLKFKIGMEFKVVEKTHNTQSQYPEIREYPDSLIVKVLATGDEYAFFADEVRDFLEVKK